jgi:hypothetical protein
MVGKLVGGGSTDNNTTLLPPNNLHNPGMVNQKNSQLPNYFVIFFFYPAKQVSNLHGCPPKFFDSQIFRQKKYLLVR